MAEIFGAAAAAAGVLQQCISILERIHDAAQRQHELPKVISDYTEEVAQCKSLAELVEAEDALKTPKMREVVVKLHSISQELQTQLANMAPPNGRIRGFLKQLTSGKKDLEALDGIMKRLSASNQHLILCVQVANIGLTRGIDKNVTANAAVVEHMSRVITEKIGHGHPLRMAKLLEGRPLNADGTVTLTKEDIAFLSTEDFVGGEVKPQTSRIIRNNEAYSKALQVNTPVGDDIWKDVGLVMIEGNKAMDGATQWNYPISSPETFVAAIHAMKGQDAPKA